MPPQLPPTFPSSSPIANGLALARDQLGFFSKLAREVGDFASYELTNGTGYLLNDPVLIREVLVAHEENFRKWESIHASKVFGTGLLASEGEFHRQMRQTVRAPLQQNRVKEYATRIVELADQRMQKWKEGEIDLTREMELLTLEIVGELLFSVPLADRAPKILEISHTVQRLSERTGIAPEDERRFAEADETLSEIGREILRERAERPPADDLLNQLLVAKQKSGEPFNAQQVLQEVRTIIMAGHVTTSITIAGAIWLLAQNPDYEKQWHDEVVEKLGTRLPTADDVDLLKFCDMVLWETLRLYPPVWSFGRETLREVKLGDYTLPPGARLLIVPWLLHRDPRVFKEPEKFDPERWHDNARARLPRCSYLPFSIGSRSCVGERFAMMEATLVLALVAQRWKFAELPSKPDPGWTTQIVYWPRRGIRLIAQRRIQ